MEERYIASVDLGTSKIAVGIARIQGQNVQVVYYRETPSKGIRNSYVLNPKKVEDVLRVAITNAQQELKIKISEVIVGLPRYYVRQEVKSASTERENEDSPILEQELRDLKNEALQTYPLKDSKTEVIYGAVAQSFSTEDCLNELESDIVGMTAGTLEGNFKVFVGNRRHSTNIDSIFNSMGISIAKKYFTPGITAKAVLKEEQMENGVALIDLGAGVSSVTIFEGRIMRFYSAIPFGGNSVTNDIKSECGISFELAENIKKGYLKDRDDYHFYASAMYEDHWKAVEELVKAGKRVTIENHGNGLYELPEREYPAKEFTNHSLGEIRNFLRDGFNVVIR